MENSLQFSDVLSAVTVDCKDNGKEFVVTDRIEAIEHLLQGTEYRLVAHEPLALLFAKRVPQENEKVVLVFSCNRLMEDKPLDRRISVSIDVESVSGIYVPKDAVEFSDGQRGVYVLKGSVVKFRAIDVIYERKEYYLVNGDFDDSKSEYTYLTTNELIIMNGQNLFDGRILD